MIIGAIAFLSDLFTIFASGIAIYLFIFKREAVKSIFRTLTTYAHKVSLSELNMKFDRLNELNANDEKDKEKVINIFNEIVGQIRGNSMLAQKCDKLLNTLTMHAEKPKTLTEHRKRVLISELRETIRHIDIQNIDDFFGGKK